MHADQEDSWSMEFTWDVLLASVVMVFLMLVSNVMMVLVTELHQMLAEPTVPFHTVVMVSSTLSTENGVMMVHQTTTSSESALLHANTLTVELFQPPTRCST
jgi:hypothetical protein